MSRRSDSMGAWLAAALLLAGCHAKGQDTAAGRQNAPPVANAGTDQSIPADHVAQLDGRGSYDPDGDPLSFHWAFDHVPEGSSLPDQDKPFTHNDSADASTTTFVPDAIGTWIVSLQVADGQASSGLDYVIVTTTEAESRPVASAGADQSAQVGTPVTLDGSASYDPGGRSLTYAWSVIDVPQGSSVADSSLTDPTAVQTSFTPDARGVYTINLVVDNGLADSAPDSVSVTATGTDNAPTANAGEDFSGEDCTALQLDGSGSADPDGDPLQYYWELQKKPSGSSATNDSFSDRSVESPTFWADVAGDYTISLTVSDGSSWSNPDLVELSVAERSYNNAPTVEIPTLDTVDAGSATCTLSGYTYDCDECDDQVVELGSNVTITDPESDPYTVHWEVVSGDATISSPDSLVTNVELQHIETTEPGNCDDDEYVFQLTVTDCTGAATVANTTVTAQCCGTSDSGSR